MNKANFCSKSTIKRQKQNVFITPFHQKRDIVHEKLTAFQTRNDVIRTNKFSYLLKMDNWDGS